MPPLDKQVNLLDPAPTWSDDDLVIIARPTDGKLFKSTLGELKAYLTGNTGINRLLTPIIQIDSVFTQLINFKVSGDARTEKFFVRLATDAAFTSVIRNATLTAPTSAGLFSGLTPDTTYFLDVVAQATNHTDSLPGTTSATTKPVIVIVAAFPYPFPVTI